MPRFDGTGPRGEGSMTGGGRGYCVVPLNEADNFYQTDGTTSNIANPYAYSYAGFPKRRFKPSRMFGGRRGQGFRRGR